LLGEKVVRRLRALAPVGEADRLLRDELAFVDPPLDLR
jgi:hypothetical protein